MIPDDAEDDNPEWDSGPYCKHWNSPEDCNEPCKCGHPCREHGLGWCSEDGCVCEEFVDAEDEEKKP